MAFIRCLVVALVAFFAFLVIMFMPYPALSPRWFFTSAGVIFVACGLAGFILPNPRKKGNNND